MMNSMPGSMRGNFQMENQVASVKLSIESLPESRIQEISLDGTETYFRPLTMSENLCKMASKIDFLAEEEGRADEEDEEDKNVVKSFQNQRWPFEGIHSRLQQALTEINVLTDVLATAHSKGPPKKEGMPNEGGKYVMFDQARKDAQPIKHNFLLPAKKKGLNAATAILTKGEKRMKSLGDAAMPDSGYHHELFRLRKFWRIRKVGVKVLGDLSYRTIGSDFPHSGNFEVIKTTGDEDDDDNYKKGDSGLLMSSRSFPNQQAKQNSSLKVVVGSDLKGTATIKFAIRRQAAIDLSNSSEKSVIISGLVNKSDPGWHRLLCYAQNVLFCREVFEKLAMQAVQFKTSSTLTPFWVVGNKITTMILPDTELVIELITDVHGDNAAASTKQMGCRNSHHQSEDIFCLKMAAMQLLIKDYQKLFNLPAPHPVCAVFGLTKVQRKAATLPFNIMQMQRVSKKESKSLLERLVDMAKHWELKRRVCEAIENVSDAIQDPYIQAQWSTLGSLIETNVRVSIMSAGYENCSRTLVNISVGTDTIRTIQKDGKVIDLSSDLHHIQIYLLSLLCSHQLCAAHEVCTILGWSIQHFCHNCGVGPRTALGSANSLMAASPVGNSSVSLRCWVAEHENGSLLNARINYQVFTQIGRLDVNDDKPIYTRQQQHLFNSEMNAVQDAKWSLLGRDWREVNWPKLFGRHFIGKLESLLTFLRSDL